MFWNVFSHFFSAEITYNSVNNFDEVNPYGILFYEHRKIFIRKINSKESHIVLISDEGFYWMSELWEDVQKALYELPLLTGIHLRM